ncbi:MAG: glycosyltransferase family 2 protein [Acidimicrobiales bacterium]
MARREGGQSLVSICVPAYMAESYLAATIDSVLAQTHQNWELHVLDNNSSDRTGDIARSYTDPRITVHRNPATLSLADNWNAAVALATAPYVKLLCADDLLHPDCLTEELAVLTADSDLALVAGRRHFIDAAGEVVLRDRGLVGLIGRRESRPAVQAVVKSGINPIGCPSAMMFRRDAFALAGGFEGRWEYTLDLELAFRLLEHGAFYGIERSLSSFRISPTSASSVMASFGAQHRTMLRRVAANPKWRVGFYPLTRGMFFSKVESVRKWMLFRAVNSRHRLVRRLPGMMLPGNSQDDDGADATERSNTL